MTKFIIILVTLISGLPACSTRPVYVVPSEKFPCSADGYVFMATREECQRRQRKKVEESIPKATPPPVVWKPSPRIIEAPQKLETPPKVTREIPNEMKKRLEKIKKLTGSS